MIFYSLITSEKCLFVKPTIIIILWLEMSQTNMNKLTRTGIKSFVGIMILMGIVKLPRFRMYWREDHLLHQGGISAVMSRTRFLQIWRYFHLADNSVAPPVGADGYHNLFRVREFLNIISSNISREYKLSRDIAIDETKNKPTQCGINL